MYRTRMSPLLLLFLMGPIWAWAQSPQPKKGSYSWNKIIDFRFAPESNFLAARGQKHEKDCPKELKLEIHGFSTDHDHNCTRKANNRSVMYIVPKPQRLAHACGDFLNYGWGPKNLFYDAFQAAGQAMIHLRVSTWTGWGLEEKLAKFLPSNQWNRYYEQVFLGPTEEGHYCWLAAEKESSGQNRLVLLTLTRDGLSKEHLNIPSYFSIMSIGTMPMDQYSWWRIAFSAQEESHHVYRLYTFDLTSLSKTPPVTPQPLTANMGRINQHGPKWNRNGSKVLFYTIQDHQELPDLYLCTLGGHPQLVNQGEETLDKYQENQPGTHFKGLVQNNLTNAYDFSPNGQWIFYHLRSDRFQDPVVHRPTQLNKDHQRWVSEDSISAMGISTYCGCQAVVRVVNGKHILSIGPPGLGSIPIPETFNVFLAGTHTNQAPTLSGAHKDYYEIHELEKSHGIRKVTLRRKPATPPLQNGQDVDLTFTIGGEKTTLSFETVTTNIDLGQGDSPGEIHTSMSPRNGSQPSPEVPQENKPQAKTIVFNLNELGDLDFDREKERFIKSPGQLPQNDLFALFPQLQTYHMTDPLPEPGRMTIQVHEALSAIERNRDATITASSVVGGPNQATLFLTGNSTEVFLGRADMGIITFYLQNSSEEFEQARKSIFSEAGKSRSYLYSMDNSSIDKKTIQIAANTPLELINQFTGELISLIRDRDLDCQFKFNKKSKRLTIDLVRP